MQENNKIKSKINTKETIKSDQEIALKSPELLRRDLLHYEDILCKDIARLVQFKVHSLYFPTQDELPKAKFIKEEKKLLIPLRRNNFLLGILLLGEVKNFKTSESLLAMLTSSAEVCLDKIYYLKLSGLDEICHLPRLQIFMQRLQKEVFGISEFFNYSIFSNNDVSTNDQHSMAKLQTENNYNTEISERHSSLGLMILSTLQLEFIQKYYGFLQAEKLFAAFSKKVKESLPEECVCTVLNSNSFAILFPGATRRSMENLAKQCTELSQSITAKPKNSVLANFYDLPEAISLQASAGYALYPQDWDGSMDSRDSFEVGHILLQKAGIALQRVLKKPMNYSTNYENNFSTSVLAYRDILLQGGNVEALYPYSQIRVNLGKDDGAREKMYFSVFQDMERKFYKGEILLTKVKKNTAEAEIIMLNNSSKPIEVGDFLQYIPQTHFQNDYLDKNKTIFYTYNDFTRVVNQKISQENVKNFSLAILQIQWENFEQPENLEQDNSKEESKNINTFEIAKMIADFLKKKSINLDFIIGNMSFNSIILFHSKKDSNIKEIYAKLIKSIEEKFHVQGAVGIVNYPYLNLRPVDIWEAVHKALDYAILLPKPHVGIFDSLAINISADRKFSQNDIFGALEEYRMSLLADSENILAWNSLGVCLAELARHSEARQAFERAYACKQDDISTCYNLGNSNLTLGDKDRAKEYFLTCILHDKKHLYARIRLGEIAEKEGDLTEALKQYSIALEDNPENSMPYRYLAKMHLKDNNNDKARELLQISLQKNPDDAISLQILADIYLDAKEDAELAEALIRQSLALMPKSRAALATLAKALEIQGRTTEAMEVRRNSVRL